MPDIAPGHLFSALQDAILAAASHPWVLVALFVFCVIDGFFPPFPSETLIIALAALNAQEHGGQPLWAVFLAGACGAFIGDNIAYFLGSRIPIDRIPWLSHGRGLFMVQKATYALQRRGPVYILAARFIPIGRVAVNIGAGAVHYATTRFRLTTAIAAPFWAGYALAIGTGAGALVSGHPLLGMVLGVIGGVLFGVVIERCLDFYQKRKAARAAGTQELVMDDVVAEVKEAVVEVLSPETIERP